MKTINIVRDILSCRRLTLCFVQRASNGPGTLNKQFTDGWKFSVFQRDDCYRGRFDWENDWQSLETEPLRAEMHHGLRQNRDEPAGSQQRALHLDGVHPNAKGYALMEPLTQAAIDRTLGNKSQQ